jgi:hypothetical protein
MVAMRSGRMSGRDVDKANVEDMTVSCVRRHCERSEAIQFDERKILDCFVASLLAMTR